MFAVYFGLIIIFSIERKINPQKFKPKTDLTFFQEYKITIINEHEIQGIYRNDTVQLYFENAYRLSDEKCFFIKK